MINKLQIGIYIDTLNCEFMRFNEAGISYFTDDYR